MPTWRARRSKWPWPRAAAAKRSGGMRSPSGSYSIPTAVAPIPQTRSPSCAGSWGFGSRWAGSGRVSTMLPRRRSSLRWNGKCCPAIVSVILSMHRPWLSTGATPSTITNAGTVPPTGSHPSTTRSGNPRPSRKRHRKPSTISGEPQCQVAGQHADQHVGFDPLGEPVVDGAQVEVIGFDAAEVAFDVGEVLVAGDHRGRVEFGGCHVGAQHVDAVEGGFGSDGGVVSLVGEAGVGDPALKVL